MESNYRDVISRRRYCLGSSKSKFHSNESLMKSALQTCYSYLTIRTAVKKVVRLLISIYCGQIQGKFVHYDKEEKVSFGEISVAYSCLW